MSDLFADFDPADVVAIQRANQIDQKQAGVARALRARARHEMRRANSEKTLADILPARIEPGDCWHVISRGDIDALSYLRHALAGTTHFDCVLLSTWCIAKPDMDELAAWLDTGRIDALSLYAGEIFPSQYGDEYEAATRMVKEYGIKLVIAKNHSKVILAGNNAEDYWLTMEGSANVNTNPRIEQTTITNDKRLFEFYAEFFNGIRSIDRNGTRKSS